MLKPGATGVLCDSAQLSDSAEIGDALAAFPAGYHEPYYKGYLRDDLAALLEACELERAKTEPIPVSKAVVARKP